MADIPINKIKIRDSRFVLHDIRIEQIDDELIENSKNPVTSGAVEEAISGLQEEISQESEDLHEELERTRTELDTKIDNNTNSLQGQIDQIEEVIPERATVHNKLVDQNSLYTKLNTKVDKVPGKQLSTMDYTAAEKQKLTGIEDNAEVNIINEISANGTILPIIDKRVEVPLPKFALEDDTLVIDG
jgi:phosphoglycerate-specific signal transduction histidine kinase